MIGSNPNFGLRTSPSERAASYSFSAARLSAAPGLDTPGTAYIDCEPFPTKEGLTMPIRLLKFALIFLTCAAMITGAQQVIAHTTDSGEAITAATLHHIKTVFLIVMENHNWTGDAPVNIEGNSAAPYINYTLLPMASYANNYNNPPGNHPSLPNYLWLEAGTNFGIHDDGLPSQHGQTTSNHLVKLLENAGIPWRSYVENISGTNCPLTDQGAVDSNGSH